MSQNELNGISLFSGAGIGEAYLHKTRVSIKVANELIQKRADLYKALYPNTKMVCGDICNPSVFNKIIELAPPRVDFIIASPPCQGMSVVGKNRNQNTMASDPRNYLILKVVEAIERFCPSFVLIENVPPLLKFKILFANKMMTVPEILQKKFGELYNVDHKVVDASDYGVAQTRQRAIIKMNRKDTLWPWPTVTQEKKTVYDAIGYLPSLEAGEKSDIKWHYARPHTKGNILCMKHTPTGHSAFENLIYYPKKEDGTRVKGYMSSYRRIRWDSPSPTITIRNDCISSQRNVHPGRLLPDGTYSDARVLTPLELMLLTSLPADWNIPDNTPEILIRQCIGESIPPLMIERIVGTIND